MKCTLLKEVFEDRLQLSSRFVSSRVSAVQSIQGAKIEADDDSLTLTTTNLGDSFHTKISATVEEPGTVVFDIKKALEFINFLEQGELELSIEENQLRIKQGKNQGFFSLYETDDFPELPTLDGQTFPLDQALLDKIPYVYFSASKDETRPVMTGIYVTNSEDGAYFVSTDGFRLSLLHQKIDSSFPNTLLPAAIFQEIVKLSKRGDSVLLTLSPEDRLVKFTIGAIDIYSRVIEGDFPPYEKVIPKSSSTVITVNPQEFQKNIRLVGIFAREEADVVIFDITKDGVTFRPKAARKKNSEVFQKIDSFEGDDLKVAFNYKYVLDFLNTVTADKIIIECTSATAPGVFKIADNNDYLHIIMPLRTEETTG